MYLLLLLSSCTTILPIFDHFQENKKSWKKFTNEIIKIRRNKKKNLWRFLPIWIQGTPQPAKLLKSNTGGVSFCWIGNQYAMPYSQKYTPPHSFFWNFARWVESLLHKKRRKGATVIWTFCFISVNSWNSGLVFYCDAWLDINSIALDNRNESKHKLFNEVLSGFCFF